MMDAQNNICFSEKELVIVNKIKNFIDQKKYTDEEIIKKIQEYNNIDISFAQKIDEKFYGEKGSIWRAGCGGTRSKLYEKYDKVELYDKDYNSTTTFIVENCGLFTCSVKML
jgi:hypothetical protein